MKLLALLPLLLGSCALLARQPGVAPAVTAPSPGLLSAQAGATAARAREVSVVLTLRNPGPEPLALRYAAQVNWGECGLPPYVALFDMNGRALAAPSPSGRLSCPELQFTRTLAPGETLPLRRTLPPLAPGLYTLNVWFDGRADGEPVRVQAAPVVVEVK